MQATAEANNSKAKKERWRTGRRAGGLSELGLTPRSRGMVCALPDDTKSQPSKWVGLIKDPHDEFHRRRTARQDALDEFLTGTPEPEPARF